MALSFDSTSLFSTLSTTSSTSVDDSKVYNTGYFLKGGQRCTCKDVCGNEINIRIPYRYT
jgi:hypothetical protein